MKFGEGIRFCSRVQGLRYSNQFHFLLGNVQNHAQHAIHGAVSVSPAVHGRGFLYFSETAKNI